MIQKVSIIGAGAYGTAIARALAYKGHHVLLWSHNETHAKDMGTSRENSRRLPGIRLPENLIPVASLEKRVQCTRCPDFRNPLSLSYGHGSSGSRF